MRLWANWKASFCGLSKKSKQKEFEMTASDQVTILVIDDDDAVRLSIAYLEDLPGRSFRVITAENGRIGVEKFSPDVIDLVLVDLRMPGA